MRNLEVARLFNLMADVLELRGENVFRMRAYRRAAQNLEPLREDVETDAHVLDHLATMELGVLTARRAWVGKASAVNTWPAKKLLAWMQTYGR